MVISGGTVGSTATVENAAATHSPGISITGGTVAGTLLNDANALVNQTGGAISGTLINSNSGTVAQSGGTVSGSISNSGYYTLSGGTFSAAGALGGPQNTVSGNFSLVAGGTINVSGLTSGTFVNQGTFGYTGGTFTGELLNQGTASIIGTGLAFSNGAENDLNLFIGTTGPITTVNFGVSGLDNQSSIAFGNATITGNILNEAGAILDSFSNVPIGTINGSLTNQGLFEPGIVTVTGTINNSGTTQLGISATTGSNPASLKATGGLTNTGILQFVGGKLTGGTLVNNPGGLIEFETGLYNIYSLSQAVNNSGGVITFESGTQVTFSSFSAGSTAGGDIQIQTGATFTSTTAFPSSGTIELQGSTAALNGGAITNTGLISGLGRISNTLLNTGVVEASGGKLTISGASSTNPAGGQIIADAASTVQYAQGLATSAVTPNAGTITINGGTFDNNNLPLFNSGIINGNGSFKTGGTGLTNATTGIIDVTAGTSFYGPVTNNGSLDVYGSSTTFFGNVTVGSSAKVKVTAGTVYFLGNAGALVGGLYTSDPSDNYFNNLTITSTGTVTGGSGDRFFLESGTAMSNAGVFNNTGTLSAGAVTNSGTFTQTGTLTETGNVTNSGTATIGGTQNWSHGTTFTNTAGTATFQSAAGTSTAENLSVNVSGGAVTFASTQYLAGLNIGGGATAQVTNPTAGNRSVFFTPSLADSGTLDLTGEDFDIQAGGATALTTISTLIKQGYNNGAWTGTGITSTAAASNPTHLTALGVLVNNDGTGHAIYGSGAALGLFDGTSPALNDVLVKYTYYGDANLDGSVDGSDYTKIDAGYNSQLTTHLTGWSNGDFNYDGKIDGSDYTLIDNAFNTQGGNLSSTGLIAASAAQFAGGTSVPEPAGLSILAATYVSALHRRRRR